MRASRSAKYFAAHFLSLAVSAWLLSACTTNPMTGRSQFLIVSEKSAINQATQAYSSMVGSLEKKGKISHDKATTDRVEGITDRLITQAIRYRPDTREWAWNVSVIDDPGTVNAFCAPGGKIAVYTGLLEKVKPSDDELAQVMGHEISHALANHGAEKMSNKLLADIIVAAAAASAHGNTNSNSQQNRADIAALGALVFINLPNSREEESEADKLGIELAARAGYDPHAAVTLWEKMMAATGEKSRTDFLNTHPASPKRMEALAALEAPMRVIYEGSSLSPLPVRHWTSTSPNEREVEPPGSHAPTSSTQPPGATSGPNDPAPLVFYSPEFEKFKAGETELGCTSQCAASFMVHQGTLKAYHDKAAWRELVLDTIKIGYRLDLAYYYLGKGAAGLGYPDASKKYFSKAVELTDSKEESCAKGFFVGCSGINVKTAVNQSN